MVEDIFTRILLTVLIIGGGLGLYWFVNRIIIARVQDKVQGLESFKRGIPGILYFTTPECIPCKTVQRPALQRVQEYLENNLQIIEIDASVRPELADYWGVLSVPTTFVIDPKGRPRRVNHGVVHAKKLLKQIEEVVENPPPELHLRPITRKQISNS